MDFLGKRALGEGEGGRDRGEEMSYKTEIFNLILMVKKLIFVCLFFIILEC